MKKVAIIGGKGRMGSRHCSTLDRLCVDFTCFDEADGLGINDVKTDNFSHFIICTPSILHAKHIRQLRDKTNKPIFVEKPAITNLDDLDILNDDNLFHGVIRRFDEMVNYISDWHKNHNCSYVSINKTSPLPKNPENYGNIYLDLAIHHIDMLLCLFEDLSFTCVRGYIYANEINNRVNLFVGYGLYGEKSDIGVFGTNNAQEYLLVDFNNRWITDSNKNDKLKFSYTQPLKTELYQFLNGWKCNASKANKICLDL